MLRSPVAYGATADAALAEDLAQEAFVVAWRRLACLADPDRFAPWLCGIVRNVAREARRHERRHAPRGTEAVARLVELPAPGPSPFDSAAMREALAAGLEALRGLAPRYREPLLLFVRLDRSHEQVAACLGLTVEAVRQRLSRARRQLRGEIERAERAALALGPRRSMAAAVVAAVLARAAPASAMVHGGIAPLLAFVSVALVIASAAVIVASGVVVWREQSARAEPAADARAPSPAPDRELPPDESPVQRGLDSSGPTLARPTVELGRGHEARASSGRAGPKRAHPRARVRHGPAELERGRPSVGMGSLQSIIP